MRLGNRRGYLRDGSGRSIESPLVDGVGEPDDGAEKPGPSEASPKVNDGDFGRIRP